MTLLIISSRKEKISHDLEASTNTLILIPGAEPPE